MNDVSLAEVLSKATEEVNKVTTQVPLRHDPQPEDYAQVPEGISPQGAEVYRKLTASGEMLASYYERCAQDVMRQAEHLRDELLGHAEAIRQEAIEEAGRADNFTKRIHRLGNTLSVSWKDNQEGL